MPEPAESRAIHLEIEVPGTPEAVWAAIASGPGISAWFVPTTVDGRPGGVITQDFGPGPEMQVSGRVQAWNPPHRFAYGEQADPGEGGMAFEFLVETTGRGTCVVRLVNSGFGHGEEWDEQYDATEHGWRIFLHLLSLHLEHFAGRPAARVQAMAMLPAPAGGDALWRSILSQFSVDGDRLTGPTGAAVAIEATITLQAERTIAFLVDGPAPGTGFFAAEGSGELLAVSFWLSLYGADGVDHATREAGTWQAWLESLGTPA